MHMRMHTPPRGRGCPPDTRARGVRLPKPQDDEIEAAFARLERFIAEHPETEWDPSKSFVAER